MYDFGFILKQERKKRGLTQKQLGDKLNVSEATICKYENNTVSPPFETMRSIAAIFNVSLDFLYGNEADSKMSLYGLSGEQIEILRKLATVFRKQNSSVRKQMTEETYQILGHITASLMEKS